MPATIMAAPEDLRDGLLGQGDLDRAAELAEAASDYVNRLFNDAGISAGTSLLARALTVNAIATVAGDWWNDLDKSGRVDAAIAKQAIASFTKDLPPGWVGSSRIDHSILGKAH